MKVEKNSKRSLTSVLALGTMVLGLCTTVPVTAARADVLSAIAQCESEGHQFAEDGKVLRNSHHRAVVGVFQINERIHGATARQLGLDIYTSEGNWAYARYLLKTEGTTPWYSSRKCWKNMARQ